MGNEPIVTDKYDPIEYWNARPHPNTRTNPGVRDNHARYLSKHLAEADEILEIGPGVGRLFGLYSHLKAVHTVDISRLYKERLRQAAKDNDVTLVDHYLDDPKSDLPFSAGQFSKGIASFVFLHVPFENIRHTMSEMARTCAEVVIISGVDEKWPKTEAEKKPSSHCFNHDYEKICAEIGCEVVERTTIDPAFALVYRRI